MYDAPFDALGRLGWVLAAATLLVLAVRAVRLEYRSGRAHAVTARARVLDTGLDATAVLVVLAFVAVLAVIVRQGLTG